MAEQQEELLSVRPDTPWPITDLVRFPRSPIDFRFHVVTARVDPVYESCLAESVARCVASGVSDDPAVAAAAAVGEAWERIAFVEMVNRLQAEPRRVGTTHARAEDFFDLPYLLEPDADRHAWAHAALAAPANWLTYSEYAADRPPATREVPASVYLPGAYTTLFETTNGLACAHTYEVALDRAVRELVERDALMLVWLTRSGGRCVTPERYLRPEYCEQISRLAGMGIRTVVRDISTDLGIRVFLVAVTGIFHSGRIGLAFGAGAHRDPRHAAYHAFREACLSWRGVAWRSLTGDNPTRDVPPSSFAAHGEYYSSWDRMHLLDFLVRDEVRDDTSDPDLDAPEAAHDGGHVDLLLQRIHTVLALDITPPRAADAGLSVVQAVVPGLVPLYLGDRGADELAWNRLPAPIGGMLRERPVALNPDFHPWP